MRMIFLESLVFHGWEGKYSGSSSLFYVWFLVSCLHVINSWFQDIQQDGEHWQFIYNFKFSVYRLSVRLGEEFQFNINGRKTVRVGASFQMKGFFLREEKSIEGCSFTLTFNIETYKDLWLSLPGSGKLCGQQVDCDTPGSLWLYLLRYGIYRGRDPRGIWALFTNSCTHVHMYTCTHVHIHNLFNIRLGWPVASQLQDSTEDCNLLLLNWFILTFNKYHGSSIVKV